MKPKLLLLVLCLLSLSHYSISSAQDVVIGSIGGNGQITWSDTFTNGFYAVEWSSSTDGPWLADWRSLAQIPGTGGLVTASVPMFLRLHFKSLEPWTKDWVVTAADGGTNLFYRWVVEDMPPDQYSGHPYYEGQGVRTGILIIHPVSIFEPAKILYTGSQPMTASTLRVQAGGNANGDCALQCRVNGGLAGEYALYGTNWTTCDFDLTSYIGQTITLELWNVNGGPGNWFYETCYIDDISFLP